MSNLYRERDLRNAIRTILDATGEFSDVWVGAIADRTRPTSATRNAVIEPVSSQIRTQWDAASTGGRLIQTRIQIDLLARDDDPQIRDETAERLLNLARNALDGQSLGGLTLPQMTEVKSWKWEKPASVERQITAILEASYLEDGWAASDTTE